MPARDIPGLQGKFIQAIFPSRFDGAAGCVLAICSVAAGFVIRLSSADSTGRVATFAIFTPVPINLVRKATEAMREHDRRRARCHARDGDRCVTIEVAGRGSGIADEAVSPRLAPLVTAKTNGRGNCLSISRRIIKPYGGQIAASRNGGGVRFWLSLPVVEQETFNAR